MRTQQLSAAGGVLPSIKQMYNNKIVIKYINKDESNVNHHGVKPSGVDFPQVCFKYS